MRCTQTMGLSLAAIEFIEDLAAVSPIKECPTCGHRSGGQFIRRVYDMERGRRAGMFEDGPDLYEYDLKDGGKAREIVQAVPWSSGPCIFLCLELDNGERVGEWSEEEIDNA